MDQNLISFKSLEITTKNLLKHARKYESCVLETGLSEKKITSDLSSSILCHDNEDFRKLIEEWHSYISESNLYDVDLVAIAHKILVQPLKKFQTIFVETKSALKKRDQVMQECKKSLQKVQKLQEKEKTGTNIVKLEAARHTLISFEEDYKDQDKVLKGELPLLHEGRIEYFQPSLEALMKIQVEQSEHVAKLFTETIPSLNNFNNSEKELKQKQCQRFSQIHALSIVGDNLDT